ncbi:MAG: hypothetical protein BGO99_02310 [Nitrosospira sp. 56-18]|nr:MAG: hypothetical protein BGO99_02310 [Nitrosospira sp. 56-18]
MDDVPRSDGRQAMLQQDNIPGPGSLVISRVEGEDSAHGWVPEMILESSINGFSAGCGYSSAGF